MLIVLMYHRICNTPNEVLGDPRQNFRDHLAYLVKHYPIVLPGDALDKKAISVCLTFDDAYYDFYHVIFPLLKEFQIPAILAISPGLIIDDTKRSYQSRLEIPYNEAMITNSTNAGLCTWKEINEMVASSLVIPASHGLSHKAIQHNNFQDEVVLSKQLLEEKTGKTIDTFIYPYGRMTRAIHQKVQKHYTYTMRIGSSMNQNWQNFNNMCYRIDGDDYWIKNKPFLKPAELMLLKIRWISNTLRLK